ncbi:Mrp/NBP35 family ATP-binding protein [Homoserinimonas sp. OAct 916]|uniref:Mrp/NBP35 family ATP-binding protein n=1 Tax=Homoserinimonas sp. OAct 916 TaxID=2211450 RepID=UPI000DBE6766|nr:Mrp/NBP35 family ATP-binding protein [Homoserinimonas sp. OAct 916]
MRGALAQVIDPELRKPITQLNMVAAIEVDDNGAATVTIRLTIAGCPAAQSITADTQQAIERVHGVTAATVVVTVMTPDERRALTAKLRGTRADRETQFGPETLTRIYTVTSGKGGVGKSTLTANLGVALVERGLSVGIIDADVYGFSIPGLLGLVTNNADGSQSVARPTRVDEMMLPPVAHGVKVISIGMFVDPDSSGGQRAAVAWRGPMLHRTITQFLTEVYFGDLDVLLLDLPPGTGDVAISVGQLLPHAEALVVTTPQPAAADVAERSGLVARQTGQEVYGVIENMSGLTQPDGTILELFGSGGGDDVARRLGVPLVARVPLSMGLREGGDSGLPIVLSDPSDPASAVISQLADELAGRGRGLAGRSLNVSVH